MMYKFSNLIEERDKQQLSTIVDCIATQYSSIKSEFNSQKEQRVIDLVVGNKPIYNYLLSYKEKKKSIGEILFGETDWPAFIQAVKASLPPETVPTDEIMKTTNNNISLSDVDEAKLAQLLEKIINLLQEIQGLFLKLIDIMANECNNTK